MKKILLFLALLACTPAYAQNGGTVTNHAFAIGKGPHVTGYTSLLCGSGQLAIGSATDPTCRTVSGDATLSAAGVFTLAASGVTAGSAGSATTAPVITVDAKGRITALSSATISGVNAATLGGATFAAPGPIGSGTPSSAVHTTVTATSLVDVSGAAAGQVKFPATQNPSANANTLDDYSEGTFTPVLSFGGASVGITYSAQSGVFTKIGNVVHYALVITLTSKGTSTGNMSIGGLPISSSSFGGFSGSVQVNNLASSAITQVQAVVAASSTTLALSRYAAGANVVTADTDYTNTSIIRVTGIYFSN